MTQQAPASARTRSADQHAGPSDAVMGRLAEVLDRLWQQPGRGQRETYKTPQYDGSGDVNYFVRQFEAVAEANEWGQEAMFLHLREALREGARDCGRPDTVTGIFAALRARYGLSPREARARLTHMKKDFKTPLQQHAAEVQRLVDLAYADLPDRHKEDMALEVFANTLGNAYLQRHLLAVDPNDLATAVRTGNEFLQIRSTSGTPRATVHSLDDEELDRVQPVGETEISRLSGMIGKLVDQMASLQGKLTDQQHNLERPQPSGRQTQQSPPWVSRPGCWGCGRIGHSRETCPTHPLGPTPQQARSQQSGNGRGPQ